MDIEMKELLLTVAHESILEEFGFNKSSMYQQLKTQYRESLDEKLGIFVTLKKKDDDDHEELRGCIGTIEGVYTIIDGIYHLAKESAFEDPRFLPLTYQEYPQIQIHISLLSSLTEIDNSDAIILGTHGVVYATHYHRALFLPEVAIEQQWSTSTLLKQLCIKASLPPEHYKTKEGKLYIFTVESFGDER